MIPLTLHLFLSVFDPITAKSIFEFEKITFKVYALEIVLLSYNLRSENNPGQIISSNLAI